MLVFVFLRFLLHGERTGNAWEEEFEENDRNTFVNNERFCYSSSAKRPVHVSDCLPKEVGN